MKKILALIIAIVMTFSIAAVPASASVSDAAQNVADSYNVGDYEATIDNTFIFVRELAEAIHSLVGGILAVFDKECPFCEKIHGADAEDPSEPSDPTDPEEPDEPVKPEPIYPEIPALPVKPVVHPEDAIYVSTVEGAEEAIANAAKGAYIVLADGLYDEIVVTKSNITIAADNSVVGFINLNGKSNVTIVGVTFDAAYAEEVIAANKNSGTGLYANIVGTQTPVKANAHDIVIKDCLFTGTPVNAGKYTPISFQDQKRTSAHAYNVTVEGCAFTTSSYYYIYLNYLQAGTIAVKNNVFGGMETTSSGMMWLSSNGSNLDIQDNFVFAWKDTAIGTSRSGASYDISVTVSNNAFIQTVEGANDIYLFLRGYKDTDAITTEGNTCYGTITGAAGAVEKE